MIKTTETVKLSQVIFDEIIYPRSTHSPALVKQYAGDLESIEAAENYISVSPDMKLLDGKHRWLAYREVAKEGEDRDITVYVYPVTTPHEQLALAVELNSTHGDQLSQKDKKQDARKLYAYGMSNETIAQKLSVTKRTVKNWLKDIVDREKEEKTQKIFDLYMACYTEEEIAGEVGVSQPTIHEKFKELSEMENFPKSIKVHALFEEEDFKPPIYNIWNWAKKTNGVSHFGNSEQRIVDNLLYLYTSPFDIVVDPFAGGGSTIDICQKRSRRYFVSDRKPIPAREHEIRKHDILSGPPQLNRRWADVTLTYLDPPYWRQAEGQYSDDSEDLANQSLEEFTKNITTLVKDISKKQSNGVIALLIQPTQWKADDHQFTDHVYDIIKGVEKTNLVLESRVSCPYSSEQYTPQLVNWAKENKKLLTLTRELIIWRCIK